MKFVITLFLLLPIIATAQTTKTLSNRALDQDLKICVNDGGVEKCPVEIDGATGKFKGVDGLADASNPGLVKSSASKSFVCNNTSGNFSIPGNSVWTTVSNWLESTSSGQFSSNAYTVAETGVYAIGGRMRFNSMSNAQLRLYMNGTTEINFSQLLSGSVAANTWVNMDTIFRTLTAGDTIVFQARQGDAGARGTLSGEGHNNFYIVRVPFDIVIP